MKKYTLEQLNNYNGLSGKPAYIGFKGKVYDLSKVFKNGEHAGVKAGTDITSIFEKGPHGEDVFNNLTVVGKLVEQTNWVNEGADLVLRLALGTIFFAHGG